MTDSEKSIIDRNKPAFVLAFALGMLFVGFSPSFLDFPPLPWVHEHLDAVSGEDADSSFTLLAWWSISAFVSGGVVSSIAVVVDRIRQGKRNSRKLDD